MLSKERAAALGEAVGSVVGSPYSAAVIVGAWCFLRPSERLALEPGDVDGDVLHVRRTLDGEGGTKARGKTRRSLRTVPLPARARGRAWFLMALVAAQLVAAVLLVWLL